MNFDLIQKKTSNDSEEFGAIFDRHGFVAYGNAGEAVKGADLVYLEYK